VLRLHTELIPGNGACALLAPQPSCGNAQSRVAAQWHWHSGVPHALEDSLSVETPRPDHARRAVDVNRPVRHWCAPAAALPARLRTVTGGLTSPYAFPTFFALIERKPMPLGGSPRVKCPHYALPTSLQFSEHGLPPAITGESQNTTSTALKPRSNFSLRISHFSLLTSHFSLLTSHFSLLTSHLPHLAKSLALVHGVALVPLLRRRWPRGDGPLPGD
jgi:hypothetical protein